MRWIWLPALSWIIGWPAIGWGWTAPEIGALEERVDWDGRFGRTESRAAQTVRPVAFNSHREPVTFDWLKVQEGNRNGYYWKAVPKPPPCLFSDGLRGCFSSYRRISLTVTNPNQGGPVNYILHLYSDLYDSWVIPQDSQYRNKTRPLILLMPIKPQHSWVMRMYCGEAVNRNMLCAFLETPHSTLWNWGQDPRTPLDRLRDFSTEMNDTVEAAQICLDYLLALPGVDGQRVGAAGVSLGGIIASLAAQRDHRIKSLALLISGADLPGIFLRSEWKSLKEFQEKLRWQTGLWDDGSLRELLEKKLAAVDPLHGTPQMNGLPVLMINLNPDSILPKSTLDRYAHEMKRHGARLKIVEFKHAAHNPLRNLNPINFLAYLPSLITHLNAMDASRDFLQATLSPPIPRTLRSVPSHAISYP